MDWRQIEKLGGAGILTRQDITDLSAQRAKVLYLMLDGLWHTADAICMAAKGREGLRRMRELRELPGVTIDRARCSGSRNYMYRLILTDERQGDLFNDNNT